MAPTEQVERRVAASRDEAEPTRHLDQGSQAWIERLSPHGADRAAAVDELHALLLKATRFELNRRGAMLSRLGRSDRDDIAHQSADDALVAVLSKLAEFRGASRFTTWAYKFALLEVGLKIRRRAWRAREVRLDPDAWTPAAGDASALPAHLGTKELLAEVEEAIRTDLTPYQRVVLFAVMIDDVPIDVLAERLETNRGDLYQTIRDARQKLRAALDTEGSARARRQ